MCKGVLTLLDRKCIGRSQHSAWQTASLHKQSLWLSPLLLLLMFSYSSLELALAFLILELYPKITNARKYRKKRSNPSLTKESMNLKILNWERKTIITKIKEETQQESTGCWDRHVDLNKKQTKSQLTYRNTQKFLSGILKNEIKHNFSVAI